MAPSKLCFFPFFLFLFLQSNYLTKGETCQQVSCGVVSIDFPFRLVDQTGCCGNPNFNLSCRNKNQTMITLPLDGDFVVNNINYSSSSLLLSDPEKCIPQRLLEGFDLLGTYFEPRYPESYIFLRCFSKANVSLAYPALKLYCLSNSNFSYWATPTYYDPSVESCLHIARIPVPLPGPYWPENFPEQILLTWVNPDCLSSCNCKNHGGPKKKSGISSGTKYSLIFILGVSFLLIVVCVIFYNVRVHCYDQRQQNDVEIFSLATEPRLTSRGVNGLDGSSIEAYPITLLDESCRLPRPNDNICSICLSDYQAKETIRTIPDCNHYFHANCIDKWLKLNAACPVCRNTPDHESSSTSRSTILFSSSSPIQ